MSRNGGSMTMTGRRCTLPLGEVSGEDLNLVYYYTIFPNMLLSLHPDYVLLHQLQRQSPNRTRVICEWLFHPDAIAQPDFDPSGAIEFWNMILHTGLARLPTLPTRRSFSRLYPRPLRRTGKYVGCFRPGIPQSVRASFVKSNNWKNGIGMIFVRKNQSLQRE